jgi:ADP-ribose pyrophosphatase
VPDEQPPELVSSRVVFERWLRVRTDTFRFASGVENTIDVVDHPGGVTLVAFDGDGRLLLVRQYRHPAGRELLELPAGTLEAGEPLEVCGERELREETGYRPGRLERLGGFFLAPGYDSEYQHVFLASDLSEDALDAEEEDLALVALPLDEALRLIDDGGIEDAKTIAALLLYLRRTA